MQTQRQERTICTCLHRMSGGQLWQISSEFDGYVAVVEGSSLTKLLWCPPGYQAYPPWHADINSLWTGPATDKQRHTTGHNTEGEWRHLLLVISSYDNMINVNVCHTANTSFTPSPCSKSLYYHSPCSFSRPEFLTTSCHVPIRSPKN